MYQRENELATQIIGLAIEVHRNLGPGLLENVYKHALCHALRAAGMLVVMEKSVSLVLDNVKLECGYRIDLLVENCVVIEVKSTDGLHDLHKAQLLTYLKLGGYRLGLLLNFNVCYLKDGVKRVIN